LLSPVLSKSVKIDQFSVKNLIIKIWGKRRADFLVYRLIFFVYQLIFSWFLFKIQILNENSKPNEFPVYRSVF
jgi:hypothetical protein